MDTLEKLFGGAPRVKLLRLFLFNPGVAFDRREIKRRSRVLGAKLTKELALFKKVKLIRPRQIKSKGDNGRIGLTGYELHPNFFLANNFRSLLNQDFLRQKTGITRRFKNCGRIKLLVISGLFLDQINGRTDIFIVGNKLRRKAIDNIIKTIEADIGRELTYATLETEDFLYRLNSSDKFIRDIFDYPHEKIIDKIPF